MSSRARYVAVVWGGLALGCAREGPLERGSARERTHTAVHFTGDVYFGESYDTVLSNSDEDRYHRSLARLRPVLETAPVVANLESTFSEPVDSSLRGRKSFLHWSKPEPTGAALARFGFVGLSLGNNHAMDYGLGALADTRAELARRGLRSFGAGSTEHEAREPLYLELRSDERQVPLAVIGAYWYRPRYDHTYKFYARPTRGGVRELSPGEIAAQIRAKKAEDPSRAVVVFPHWGRNYRWRNREQQRLAHALVDAGADLIIGHGAHAYQEVERYRDRWILYGLGNLVFLSPGRYEDSEVPPFSMLATLRWQNEGSRAKAELVLRFIASDNRRTEFQPYIATGDEFRSALAALSSESCRRADDFCAAAAVDTDESGPHVRLPITAWADGSLLR